jgi:hypothetical protein
MQSIHALLWGNSLDRSRGLALAAMAVLLAAADVIPDNRYVDPDRLEFAIAVAAGVMALVVTVYDRAEPGAMARWGKRLVLLAFTFALLIPLAEFATRVIFREVTTSSDFGGYFSRRWLDAGAARINSAGFREREFTDAKPPGTYRIAVVGDSFTYGNGIRQEDRYSDLMQAQLPTHFEVLNFGQPGANTPEHRHRVEMLLPQIHPDFVLLQWYVNDTEDDDSTGRPTFHPLLPFRGLHSWFSEHSAFYTIANMQWAETQVLAGMTVSYPEYLKRRLGDPNSRDSQLDRRLLNELIEMCKRAGVPVGIVLFPDTAASMEDGYPFGYLHQRVLDVCAEQNITCLDLRKDFSQVKERQSLWANQLDHHPSARANAIAAGKILETFSKMWVAPPTAAPPIRF